MGGVFIGNAFFGKGQSPSDLGVILWLLSPLFAIFVFLWLRRRIAPDLPLKHGEPATLRALSWYDFAMSMGPGPGIATLVWTLLRAVPFVGDMYFAARIWSKDRLSHSPVLVLRSFSNPGTARLIAKAVAPALGEHAVLVALVHPSQTSAALNAGTHDAWMPLTLGQTNERWREWFRWHLRSALAVVVDASIMGESTAWELATALEVLGRERVAVLVPSGGAQAFPGLMTFEYTHERPAALRFELSKWIRWLIFHGFKSGVQLPAAQASAAE
jgi:hypothetical protein